MVNYQQLLAAEFHLAQAKLHLHQGELALAVKQIQEMIVAGKNFELSAIR